MIFYFTVVKNMFGPLMFHVLQTTTLPINLNHNSPYVSAMHITPHTQNNFNF